MDRQELVTKLTEYVGKPVHISSVVSGQRVGGTGELKDIIIDSDQNGCVKVEFKDGRMFGVRENELSIEGASKAEAKKAVEDGEGLNVDAGDEKETDEAKADREAREEGKTPNARRKAKAEADDEEDVAEDDSDEADAEDVEADAPKVRKRKTAGKAKTKK